MKSETTYTGSHEKDESEDNTTNIRGKCSCGCSQPLTEPCQGNV